MTRCHRYVRDAIWGLAPRSIAMFLACTALAETVAVVGLCTAQWFPTRSGAGRNWSGWHHSGKYTTVDFVPGASVLARVTAPHGLTVGVDVGTRRTTLAIHIEGIRFPRSQLQLAGVRLWSFSPEGDIWSFGDLQRHKVAAQAGVEAPSWMVILLTGLYPTVLTVRWFRRARRLPSECPKCRYDLTGNVSGICPECGTPVEAATLAMSAPPRPRPTTTRGT
jgi:hypothetical protein